MDESHDHHREDRGAGPTYKSLFIAACAIIGSTFGWWFTNFISDFNAISARVAVLEIRVKEFEWTFKINSRKIDTHDEQLRQLERHAPHSQGNRGNEP